MRSLHGVHVHGFPNLFIEGLSHGARLISNITHNLDQAGRDVAAVVAHCVNSGIAEEEVTAEAEDAWMDLLNVESGSLLGSPDCTPGYYNNEGRQPGPRDLRDAAGYPYGPVAYFEHIEKWRGSGRFDGLEFTPA